MQVLCDCDGGICGHWARWAHWVHIRRSSRSIKLVHHVLLCLADENNVVGI